MKKTAFITGITGQDGAYLARLLLDKGYKVHGLVRRLSTVKMGRINDILSDIEIHYGDMGDGTSLIRIISKIQPDEIYNLAALTSVPVSFDCPEDTADSTALGCLRLLEAIRTLKMEQKVRFYQASTSEQFGNHSENILCETTPFYPQSPYAAAKLYAHVTTRLYREAYKLHASNGILFNHESPLRGEEFVTRKITLAVAAIKKGKPVVLTLGNLNSIRDWGHAKDYVEGMWKMLQQPEADDYILATGVGQSVRTFVEKSLAYIGIEITWRGEGISEEGYDASTNRVYVRVDAKYYRPIDVNNLLGDASKARRILGWEPKTTLDELIKEMIDFDLASD